MHDSIQSDFNDERAMLPLAALSRTVTAATAMSLVVAVSDAYGQTDHTFRWVTLSRSSEVVVQLDTTTITEFTPGIEIAWVRLNYLTDQKTEAGKHYVRSAYRTFFNCKERQLKLERAILYTRAGNVVSSSDGEFSTWQAQAPETIGEAILDEGCKVLRSHKSPPYPSQALRETVPRQTPH